MGQIILRGRPATTTFHLIGGGRHDENAATAALGWCMARAPGFLEAVAAEIGAPVPGPSRTVSLQEHGGEKGITDIEIRDPGRLAWILEAKLGFGPPGETQLGKYASRLRERDDAAAVPLLVVIARSDRRELYLCQSVGRTVGGIPVLVLSWGQIRSCAVRAQAGSDHAGKRLLTDLMTFLDEVIPMQSIDSSMAFVVSISEDRFGGGTTTFRDVVLQHGMYFHPVGDRWPIEPPNYMAFHWDGRLQSIHHVNDYEVITSWKPHFPDTIEEEIRPHFLYRLGPAIVPPHEVRTGDRIRQANRVSAAIDLLLTCSTISEAWERTNARAENAKLRG